MLSYVTIYSIHGSYGKWCWGKQFWESNSILQIFGYYIRSESKSKSFKICRFLGNAASSTSSRLFTDAVGRCTERAHRQCWKLESPRWSGGVDGCSSQIDLGFRRSYRFYHGLSWFIMFLNVLSCFIMFYLLIPYYNSSSLIQNISQYKPAFIPIEFAKVTVNDNEPLNELREMARTLSGRRSWCANHGIHDGYIMIHW